MPSSSMAQLGGQAPCRSSASSHRAGGHPAVGVVAVGVVEQEEALRVREEVASVPRRVGRLKDERVAALDAPVLGCASR